MIMSELNIDNKAIKVELKISRNKQYVSIMADGKLLRKKSGLGIWRYIYRFKLIDDNQPHYYTVRRKFESSKLPHNYSLKMIESISCVEIDYSFDGPHANPIKELPSYISLSEEKPKKGQRVKVLCELDGVKWEEVSVFMGTKMACEYNGRKTILGWLPCSQSE